MVSIYCDFYFDHNKGASNAKRGQNLDRVAILLREKNMSDEWTPTRISILIALWNEGLTTSVIGVRLGVTKNAVVGKVHRLGLPKRGSPIRLKPRPAQIISLEALRPGMCSWPEGEPGKEDFRFCGDQVTPDKPYCPHHCERAYVKNIRDKRTAAA